MTLSSLVVVLSGGPGALFRSTPTLFHVMQDPGGEVTKVLCLAGGKTAPTLHREPTPAGAAHIHDHIQSSRES